MGVANEHNKIKHDYQTHQIGFFFGKKIGGGSPTGLLLQTKESYNRIMKQRKLQRSGGLYINF
jgi:glutamate-1-semialdehyde aminotransferase